MASKEEAREPLSFWGTVGADMVAGLILGGVSTILTVIVVGSVVKSHNASLEQRMAADMRSLEGRMARGQLRTG